MTVVLLITDSALCVCVQRVCNVEKSRQRFPDASLLKDLLYTKDDSQSTGLQGLFCDTATIIPADLAIRGKQLIML